MGPKPIKIHKVMAAHGRIRAECTLKTHNKRLSTRWENVTCGHCLKHRGTSSDETESSKLIGAIAAGHFVDDMPTLQAGQVA